MQFYLTFALWFIAFTGANAFDFSAPVPPGGRPNPYQLSGPQLEAYRRAGLRHALFYPERELGVVLPYQAFRRAFTWLQNLPIFSDLLAKLSENPFIEAKTLEQLFKIMGLIDYPETEGEGSFLVPFPESGRPKIPMGVTIAPHLDTGVDIMTFSCATCHAREVFGRPVLGLNNLFSRANEFAELSRNARFVTPTAFALASGATAAETKIYRDSRRKLRYVQSKHPIALGLDTSLATVALSLARREPDPWATMSISSPWFPRKTPLATMPSDSKPGVWWVVKYKNRFLSDAALEGDPILTNILWNDIGRGADLPNLSNWIQRNPKMIQELNTAVFSSRAPHWTDFFPAETIHLEKAKRGKDLFDRTCSRCHGIYEKGWDVSSGTLSLTDQLKTTRVKYSANTVTVNVGTDPFRWMGMKYLAPELNRLAVTKTYGMWVTPNEGYVPPPLEGIWIRWPYLHNNSVPNLCQLLTPSLERIRKFSYGAPKDPSRDFDSTCVGFPTGDQAPSDWQSFVDTEKPGLSNMGHDEGIFTIDGKSWLTDEMRSELIEFLKTL